LLLLVSICAHVSYIQMNWYQGLVKIFPIITIFLAMRDILKVLENLLYIWRLWESMVSMMMLGVFFNCEYFIVCTKPMWLWSREVLKCCEVKFVLKAKMQVEVVSSYSGVCCQLYLFLIYNKILFVFIMTDDQLFYIVCYFSVIFFQISSLFPNEAVAVRIHHTVFIPTIETQCSEEQKSMWLKKAHNYEIIGTYAQTEIGHGSSILLTLTAKWHVNICRYLYCVVFNY